jgi:hypothetical protein
MHFLKFMFYFNPYDKWARYHGMARPRVADGGTACNMEGS